LNNKYPPNNKPIIIKTIIKKKRKYFKYFV
jgi:hypothetical protein